MCGILFSEFQSADHAGSTTTRGGGKKTKRVSTNIVSGADVAETYSCAPNKGEIKFAFDRFSYVSFFSDGCMLGAVHKNAY